MTQLFVCVKYGLGPWCHAWLRRVSPSGGTTQLSGCLKELAGGPLEWDAGLRDNAQGVIKNTVEETGVCAATPSWCAVLSCRVKQAKGSCRQCFCASTPSRARKLPQKRVPSFLRHVSRGWRNVSDLSNFTLRLVKTGQNCKSLSLALTLSLLLTSRLCK